MSCSNIISRRRRLLCLAPGYTLLAALCLGASSGISTLSHAGGHSAMQRDRPLILSQFSSSDPRPDGNLDKSFWSAASRVSFDQAAWTRDANPHSATQVASRWTRESLYLAFWCRYQTLSVFEGEDPHAERWELWNRDVVEAFIAPDSGRPSHYFEFEVAPNNQWIDLEVDLTRQPFNNAHWNSGFEHVTRVDTASHLWTSEWRIPLAALTRSAIRPGDAWRINFYRMEGLAPHRLAMSWGALPRSLPQNAFHQPESFGVLQFVNASPTRGSHEHRHSEQQTAP